MGLTIRSIPLQVSESLWPKMLEKRGTEIKFQVKFIVLCICINEITMWKHLHFLSSTIKLYV